MEEPAIEVRDLTITYGDLVAVDHITFDVVAGSLVAILGPNGAGKTSTVECLEGFRPPASGTVRVLGADPSAQHASLTRRVGVMLQSGGVYTGIRPLEALRLFASYYDNPHDPVELLERVGLGERRHTTWRHLSGGEQQRLSLALALVGRPELAFLDEPTAGIDTAGRQLIRSIVRDLRDNGVTVVLTTHDLDEAEKLADRVIIVDRGHILAQGTPQELMNDDDADSIHFGAASGIDTDALSAALGASVIEISHGEYRADLAPDPQAVARLTAWLADHDLSLADLRAGRQTLEDVFLRLTTEADDARDDDAPVGVGRRRSRRRKT